MPGQSICLQCSSNLTSLTNTSVGCEAEQDWWAKMKRLKDEAKKLFLGESGRPRAPVQLVVFCMLMMVFAICISGHHLTSWRGHHCDFHYCTCCKKKKGDEDVECAHGALKDKIIENRRRESMKSEQLKILKDTKEQEVVVLKAKNRTNMVV
jgi:hypothetical protein